MGQDFPTLRTLLKKVFWMSFNVFVCSFFIPIHVAEEFSKKGRTLCSHRRRAILMLPTTLDFASSITLAMSFIASMANPFLFSIVLAIEDESVALICSMFYYTEQFDSL